MIDYPIEFANKTNIEEINKAINDLNKNPISNFILHNISETQIILSLMFYKFEEDILYKLLNCGYGYHISKKQPMSKEFIAANLQRLNPELLIENENISEEIKNYIRMFI